MRYGSEMCVVWVWRGARFRRAWLVCAPLVVVLLTSNGTFTLSGWTQEVGAVATLNAIAFHIPSQPLDSALQAYSKASGVEVLYESSIAAELNSSPVEGTFSPETALRTLLIGTELTVQYTRSDAITLALPSSQQDLPPMNPLGDADLMLDTLRITAGESTDQDGLREFSQATQLDIESALRKNARTRTGSYRASVKLWVDPSRTVRRAELAQSTGDPERDASIADTLQGLVLRQVPPANTPQPVRVVIVVRSL